MIRRRLNYVMFYVRLLTLLLPLAAFATAAYIRFASGWLVPLRGDVDPGAYFHLLLFATVVWAVVSDHFRLCHVDQLFAAGGKTRRLLGACATTYASIMTVTFFYRNASYSRLFIGISAAALFGWAVLLRLGIRVALERSCRRGSHSVRVLIIGADEGAQRVARRLIDGQLMPCSIVGFLALPGQDARVPGYPTFRLEDIPRLASGNGIDDIVIAISPDQFGQLRDIVARVETLSVPTRVVLDFGEGISLRETLFDFGGIPMLDLRATPADTANYFVLKRMFDVAFSLAIIAVTSPLMIFIALAIRLTSPGKVIFTQERIGLSGKVFKIYKFRTMRAGPAIESDTRWTTPGDERRTRLGAWLRRWNLDELPQFFNVLRGDMSVVGPRPERPFFVQKFLQEVAAYGSRHYLKAGITGWAQVNGWRGDTSIEKRIEHDLYYLTNWSLTLDLQIILLTVLQGVSSKNAY